MTAYDFHGTNAASAADSLTEYLTRGSTYDTAAQDAARAIIRSAAQGHSPRLCNYAHAVARAVLNHDRAAALSARQ